MCIETQTFQNGFQRLISRTILINKRELLMRDTWTDLQNVLSTAPALRKHYIGSFIQNRLGPMTNYRLFETPSPIYSLRKLLNTKWVARPGKQQAQGQQNTSQHEIETDWPVSSTLHQQQHLLLGFLCFCYPKDKLGMTRREHS